MSRRFSNVELRKGGIALPSLIAFPVVLLALVAGLSSRVYRDINVRMQNEADAAALAGADSLLGDASLSGELQAGANSCELYTLLTTSRSQIQLYAKNNPVLGYSIPDWNLTTPTSGDLIFGTYDRMASTPATAFNAIDPVDANQSACPSLSGVHPATNLQLINSVKVYMRRSQANGNPIKLPRMPLLGTGTADALTLATAMLDGDLQGFQPLFADRPIPLVPIALSASELSNQSMAGFTDNLVYDPSTGQFSATPGQDRLPEFTLTMTAPGAPVPPTAVEWINQQNSSLLAQIRTGVFTADLAGGKFVLQPDTTAMILKLPVSIQSNFTTFNSNDSADSILKALQQVALTPSVPRIWPIYSYDATTSEPIVTGFMAARLASVQYTLDAGQNVQTIKLTLQPTRVSEPSTVTNFNYRTYGSVSSWTSVPNLTIAKLRLVP